MLALARRLGQMGSSGPPLHPERALPLVLESLQQLWHAQVSRDYRGGDGWQRRRRQQPEQFGRLPDDLFDEPEPQMRLPDLDTIHQLNPQLHEIILQHETVQK